MPDFKLKRFETLTTSEKIFKPVHEFTTWIFGDPDSKTFDTRKTFFETLIGIFGFFIVGRGIKEVFGKNVL